MYFLVSNIPGVEFANYNGQTARVTPKRWVCKGIPQKMTEQFRSKTIEII